MIPAGYDTVKLVDRTGELVKWTFVPPLRVPPDVIIWGNRQFIRVIDKFEKLTDGNLADSRTAMVYREAMHLHAVYISDKPTEIA